MARRELLTEDERRRLFDPQVDQVSLIQQYLLTSGDLAFIETRRGEANALGLALHISLLRHPGFPWSPGTEAPDALVGFLAQQLHIDPSVLASYAKRTQTFTDHALEAMAHLTLRPFQNADKPWLRNIAAEAAQASDRGAPIIAATLEALRRGRIALPSTLVIERAGIAGRAQARRQAAEALMVGLTPHQIEALDALLVNDPDLGMSRLAWARDIPESPSPANLNSVLDRLQFVRGLALDPTLASAIHPDRFRQFVREGAIAPAFLLSDYGPRRRRATLVAQMLDLEWRLSDAGLELFEKLIGSFFTRARRRHDQRYQATAREVGQLMGLFDRTISALSDSIERGVDPIEVINETIGWHRLLEAQPKVAALASLANEDPLIGATDKYASLRRFGPAFLETFAFRASKGGRTIVAAVDLLRDLNKAGRREVPPDAPMPFQPRIGGR